MKFTPYSRSFDVSKPIQDGIEDTFREGGYQVNAHKTEELIIAPGLPPVPKKNPFYSKMRLLVQSIFS